MSQRVTDPGRNFEGFFRNCIDMLLFGEYHFCLRNTKSCLALDGCSLVLVNGLIARKHLQMVHSRLVLCAKQLVYVPNKKEEAKKKKKTMLPRKDQLLTKRISLAEEIFNLRVFRLRPQVQKHLILAHLPVYYSF